MPAHGFHVASPKPSRRAILAVFGSIAIAAVILGSICVGSLYGWPESSPTARAVVFLHSQGEQFPTCALVSISWQDENRSAVGFTVVQTAGGVRAVTCDYPSLTAPDPPNDCPPAVCSGVYYSGAPPILYQAGTNGTAQFVASQSDYTFIAYGLPSTTNTSSDRISVGLSYTTPVIPPTWYLGTRAGLVVDGLVAIAAGIAFAYLGRTQRRIASH
jgi:hypothetical protein